VVVLDSTQKHVIDPVIPKPKKTTPKLRYKYYKVRSGDTLSEIADRHRTTVSKIKKANGLRNNTIRPGQVLKIPK
jgi:LysM repeat protein